MMGNSVVSIFDITKNGTKNILLDVFFACVHPPGVELHVIEYVYVQPNCFPVFCTHLNSH